LRLKGEQGEEVDDGTLPHKKKTPNDMSDTFGFEVREKRERESSSRPEQKEEMGW